MSLVYIKCLIMMLIESMNTSTKFADNGIFSCFMYSVVSKGIDDF